MKKQITADDVKAKFKKELETAKEQMAKAQMKHHTYEPEHARAERIHKEIETIRKKMNALFQKPERFEGNYETAYNREYRIIPARLQPLRAKYSIELMREALDKMLSEKDAKIYTSDEYKSMEAQRKVLDREADFSIAHDNLDHRILDLKYSIERIEREIKESKEPMWWARYCRNNFVGGESSFARQERVENAREERRKQKITLIVEAIKQSPKQPPYPDLATLKCSCGAQATHICVCGCLCCGTDSCEFGCGGAVLPLKEGKERGIYPRFEGDGRQ
jgi:hypothetical protein